MGVATRKDKFINVLGNLVFLQENLQLVLYGVVVVLDVPDHEVNQA